jgi:hypothetical protein
MLIECDVVCVRKRMFIWHIYLVHQLSFVVVSV